MGTMLSQPEQPSFGLIALVALAPYVEPGLAMRALITFGLKAQMDVAQEELAELIVALSHEKRGRKSNIEEEMADAILMLEQMLLGVNLAEVATALHHKQARLRALLDAKDLEE